MTMDLSRRRTLQLLGALPLAGTVLRSGFVQAQSAEPIRIGCPIHRTGIGATYGRWYERVSVAAVARINAEGGINGRPVELVIEDDATDPKRGAELMDKFATLHKVDVVCGTLFSNVVIGSAPRAGELKMPYFVCSEGHHVASGMLNRWVVQPGITDVKSQVIAMAPWISDNLGKKVTMIIPDYAFGYDHRDNFREAIKAQGGEVIAEIAIPPTEMSFFRYFPKIPRETEVVYHVMVGLGVLSFVKELTDYFGRNRPEIFGFIDSLEGIDLASPGLEGLENTHFWEGMPRQDWGNPYDAIYREAVGVDASGASLKDSRDVSTYAHMFSCWETLYTIKHAMEACDYQGVADRQALIEAVEDQFYLPLSAAHPQGAKVFNGNTHQAFGRQHISRYSEGALKVIHTTSIEDGLYPDEVNYRAQSF